MARWFVLLLCAGMLGACGPEPPPEKTLHLPLVTPHRAGGRVLYARGDTLWSIRGDGSGRMPIGYLDSTGVFVVICGYVVVREGAEP